MLGTLTCKKDPEVEHLRDQLDRIFAAADSVSYAAPEVRDSALHSLYNVVQQVKRRVTT